MKKLLTVITALVLAVAAMGSDDQKKTSGNIEDLGKSVPVTGKTNGNLDPQASPVGGSMPADPLKCLPRGGVNSDPLLVPVRGADGKPGRNGKNGRDGRNGKDGKTIIRETHMSGEDLSRFIYRVNNDAGYATKGYVGERDLEDRVWTNQGFVRKNDVNNAGNSAQTASGGGKAATVPEGNQMYTAILIGTIFLVILAIAYLVVHFWNGIVGILAYNNRNGGHHGGNNGGGNAAGHPIANVAGIRQAMGMANHPQDAGGYDAYFMVLENGSFSSGGREWGNGGRMANATPAQQAAAGGITINNYAHQPAPATPGADQAEGV